MKPTKDRDRLRVPLTPDFDKLKPLEQIHELEDFLDAIDEKIDEAERADKRRH
jgi:hypothetical protein